LQANRTREGRVYAPAMTRTRASLVAFAALGALWGGWDALLPAV
jgi:hypothetical protein